MEKSYSRVCFIVNPAAKRNRSVKYVDWINREAKQRWHYFEIIIISENQSIRNIAAEKAETYDIIVACGGDGTINQVVNGMAGSEAKLGLLPVGSGNDFVKSLFPDPTPANCMEFLSLEKTVSVDLIHCRGDAETCAINTLGAGLDGLANFHAKNYSRLWGAFIYMIGALKAVLTFRGSTISLTVDGETQKDHYLMVTFCNGKWEGGSFYLSPLANPSDGYLNLVTIKTISRIKVLGYLLQFHWGPSSFMKALETKTCRSVVIHSELPLSVHADGEHLGNNIHTLDVNIVRKGIEVISP